MMKRIKSVKEITNGFTAELKLRKQQQDKIISKTKADQAEAQAKHDQLIKRLNTVKGTADEESKAAENAINAFTKLLQG